LSTEKTSTPTFIVNDPVLREEREPIGLSVLFEKIVSPCRSVNNEIRPNGNRPHIRHTHMRTPVTIFTVPRKSRERKPGNYQRRILLQFKNTIEHVTLTLLVK
jgi:hypothetical protein